ncbi:MAG: metallophosphoesterase [Acidobacteria bacterium]|nr:metallophosphoesterase [Acidobacteriota bacterium]
MGLPTSPTPTSWRPLGTRKGPRLAVYECEISAEHSAPEPVIGLVNDVHQNTLLLKKALDIFERLGVNVIFALGDYSYCQKRVDPRDPINDDIARYMQFKTVMDMLVEYLDSRPSTMVLLMGNHETDPTYYEGGLASQSHTLIRHLADTVLRRHARVILHPDPFASFDLGNAILARVGGKGFLLAHAISETFVNALYRGLRADTESTRLVSEIGRERYEVLADSGRFERAASLWKRFVSCIDQNRRDELIDQITENISDALVGVSFPSRGKPRMGNWDGLESLGLLSETLRYSFDYLICGHFHADIGLIPVMYSPAMGHYWNFVVGGAAGFQPQKVISKEHTTYVIFPTRKSASFGTFIGQGVQIRSGVDVEKEYGLEGLAASMCVAEWDLGRTPYAEPHDSHGVALRISSKAGEHEDPASCDLSGFDDPRKNAKWIEYLRGGGILPKSKWNSD